MLKKWNSGRENGLKNYHLFGRHFVWIWSFSLDKQFNCSMKISLLSSLAQMVWEKLKNINSLPPTLNFTVSTEKMQRNKNKENFPLPKHFSGYHLPPHKETNLKKTHHLPPHPFISPLLIAPSSSEKLKVDVISCTQSAVQDSSISDIVCRSVCLSEPTNNQSLGSIKEWP